MPNRSWIDDEPSAFASLRQAAHLFVSGLQRPLLCLASVGVLIGVVVGAVFLPRRAYAPSVILRVVEPERDPAEAMPPRRKLAEYVRRAVFTSGPLLQIIRQEGLYPRLAEKDPRAALESFREDIDVEVYQNYFVEQRPIGGAPRSARVRVGFHDRDPQRAVAVTRKLAKLVVDHERAAESEQMAERADFARRDVERAREVLANRRAEVALERARIGASPVPEPEREVQLVAMAGSLPALELRQDEAERREATLDLSAALERHGAGTSYEVVDDAAVTNQTAVRARRMVLALGWLVAGLPLVAMAVGAYAPRKGVA